MPGWIAPATVTEGVVTLTDPSALGPFNESNGSVWFLSEEGLRFVLSQDVVLPLSGTLTGVVVRAESPGAAYNVANNTINQLSTSVPGLTVNNPDPGSGSWVTSSGTDAESDVDLALRCMERWPTLGEAGAVAGTYDLWAKAADGTVTRTKVFADGTVAGQVDVYVAGAAGALSGGVVAAVQDYIDQRVPLCVSALVLSPTNHAITIAGDVYVAAAMLATATAAVATALDELASTTEIGGTFYFSQLEAAIQDVSGVRNVELSSPVADVVLGATEVATLTNNLVFHAI